MQEKRCPYCQRLLTLNPRVRKRRKTCGRPSCQKALKAENNTTWRRRHSDYFHDDYARVKAWLARHPGYLKQYRANHPEYVQKNREDKRRRYRQKKVRVDIQAKVRRQPPGIIDQLWDLSRVDIQDEIILQPIEITYLFSALPCLDIQDSIDKSPCLKDNGLIEARR